MTKLNPDEIDALRTFYKTTKGDRIHYAGNLEKALEKVLADYPEEPKKYGTPIMASCPDNGSEHLHIRVPSISNVPWDCNFGSWAWDSLTGARVEVTNLQLVEMDYWRPEERWITKDEISQVVGITRMTWAMVDKVVRAMGFRVGER